MKIEWSEKQCTLLKVIDGDTIDVRIDMGFYIHTEQRLRIYGVDTPERGQPLYDAAKAFVSAKLKDPAIRLITYKGDKYGRFLADVLYRDPLVIGAWRSLAPDLIDQGLGKSYFGGTKVV